MRFNSIQRNPSSSWRVRPTGHGIVGTLGAATAPAAAFFLLRLLLSSAQYAWPSAGGGATPSVDDVVLGVIAWVAVLLCAWLTLGVTLTSLTLLPGRVGAACSLVADRVTPAVVRRSLAMALGVSVGTVALPVGNATGARPVAAVIGHDTARDAGETGGRLSATADGPGQEYRTGVVAEPAPAYSPRQNDTEPSPAYRASQDNTEPSPGYRASDATPAPSHPAGPAWTPTRPHRSLSEGPTLLTPAPRVGAAVIEHVTVHRGDCLWVIAARHLGPEATDSEIAQEWPRWYAANRALIGDDPDLIHPGQQLVPPTGSHLP